MEVLKLAKFQLGGEIGPFISTMPAKSIISCLGSEAVNLSKDMPEIDHCIDVLKQNPKAELILERRSKGGFFSKNYYIGNVTISIGGLFSPLERLAVLVHEISHFEEEIGKPANHDCLMTKSEYMDFHLQDEIRAYTLMYDFLMKYDLSKESIKSFELDKAFDMGIMKFMCMEKLNFVSNKDMTYREYYSMQYDFYAHQYRGDYFSWIV